MALNDFSALDALKPDTHFLLPQAQSKTSPVSNTRPKDAAVQPFRITQIPGAMRQMGWHTGAALMQRWFDTAAWELPAVWKSEPPDPTTLPSSCYDDRIVRMGWALAYKRAQIAMRDVHGKRVNAAALAMLCGRLKQDGWDGERFHSLGRPGIATRELDAKCQVNAASFGHPTDTLDGMYGALGVATAKVGLVGEAWRDARSGQRLFHAKAAGLYIRDNYDFNGAQFLGIWTATRVLTKAESAAVSIGGGEPSYVSIDNEGFAQVWNRDFRRYRGRTGRGGDFIIYSDVEWVEEDLVMDITEAWEQVSSRGATK